MSKKGEKYKNKEEKEVEELLRAAEDEMVLNLNLHGHLSHSSSPIDQDLARRFKALKSKPTPSQITRMPLPPKQKHKEEQLDTKLGADLYARFAALKGSSSIPEFQENPRRSEDHHRDKGKDGNEEDDEVSKSEVEKVMQWAMDAARLDPSRSDEEIDSGDDEDSDSDSDEDGGKRPRQK